jgi:hypothetical protein
MIQKVFKIKYLKIIILKKIDNLKDFFTVSFVLGN